MLSVINFFIQCIFFAFQGFVGFVLILILLWVGIKILKPSSKSSRHMKYRDFDS